jgi:hypothetical protein
MLEADSALVGAGRIQAAKVRITVIEAKAKKNESVEP